jgi:sec-independent protein translocase protein TatC
LLAALGVAFCHFLVLPRVIHALLAITGQLAQATFGIAPTINFILLLLLAFALVFQTPLVMIALARIGVVNARMLMHYRRYAVMGTLLVGGFAAPDASPMTMLMLAVPMYVLYEASIWIIVPLEKSWRRAAASY